MMEALLSKDPIVTCLYRRKSDGKFLVCKSKYNKKIGLPIVKILVSNYSIQYGKATSKDISVQVVNAFRKEFGLDPEILNYYEGTKTSFVNNGAITNGNNMAFDMTDAGDYKGKPTITQNPSGDYTEVQWMSYNQILELVKTNSFDSSSLYYVLRSREQHRIKPILDSRLSLRVYADKTGLKIYNNPADPMSLTISGGKTLDECKVEETSDYIIYADGGTQVRMGRTGLAQKYIEALNTIYAEETSKGTNIFAKTHMTSDIAFHSHLLDVLNEEHNKEIEAIYEAQLKTKNVMAEEPYLEPLSEQRVFIAINFACRVDKHTGEIYIGEGYENLIPSMRNINNNLSFYENDNGYILEKTKELNLGVSTFDTDVTISLSNLVSNEKYSANVLKSNTNTYKGSVQFHQASFLDSRNILLSEGGTFTSIKNGTVSNYHLFVRIPNDTIKTGEKVEFRAIITKTSTPKPFVKSAMPSGKLSFITNATSETHSFVMKGVSSDKTTSSFKYLYFLMQDMKSNTAWGVRTSPTVEVISNQNLLLSNFYKKLNTTDITVNPVNGKEKGVLGLAPLASKSNCDSFKQLLIYKGNLTEVELKVENNKLDFIQFEL